MKARSSAITIWRIVTTGPRPQQVDRAVQRDPARTLDQHQVADAWCELALQHLGGLVGVSSLEDARVAGCPRRLGDPPTALPDRHDGIDRLPRQRTDLAVQPFLVRAELEHVAENGDAAPSRRHRRLGKELECPAHADG